MPQLVLAHVNIDGDLRPKSIIATEIPSRMTIHSQNSNNNIDMSYLEANEFGAEHMNLDLEAMLARGTLVDSPSLKKLDHWQGSNTQLAYIK